MNQEVTRDAGDGRYLLVRAGTLSCAVPAGDVVRVVRGLQCHPVPGADIRLLGLAQYGGEPLPVLDLQALIGGGPSSARHRSTVILGRGRRRDRPILGVAVDGVLRIVDGSDREAGEGGGTVRIDGDPVTRLDTGRFLDAETDEAGAADG